MREPYFVFHNFEIQTLNQNREKMTSENLNAIQLCS